ncbi:response regulator transcription factor [Caballeronia novacaledonica]|uniref:response regulator transcription factor n=1 Tax=Caballeronia novacaledonica TaxID=1544861 RepID=UPI001EE1893E|nr:response regulator transcription factor [Caballeronia novacaledonica]GJH13638.1 response regulator transcription factor [Caballeronia novacaledonica]
MRVLIVDDHALFRAGLALLLNRLFPDVEVLHASTVGEGVTKAQSEKLNIVFLDLELPDGHGFDALSELKESRPSLPVIVTSADERVETVARCVELRAMGYVPKSASTEALHAAISAVLAGGIFLPASSIDVLGRGINNTQTHSTYNVPTSISKPKISTASDLRLAPREFECLAWLTRGLPTKSIATHMGLEDITVRKYVSNLLQHFNVRRRTELIVALAESGIRLGTPPVTDPAHDRRLPTSTRTRAG